MSSGSPVGPSKAAGRPAHLHFVAKQKLRCSIQAVKDWPSKSLVTNPMCRACFEMLTLFDAHRRLVGATLPVACKYPAVCMYTDTVLYCAVGCLPCFFWLPSDQTLVTNTMCRACCLMLTLFLLAPHRSLRSSSRASIAMMPITPPAMTPFRPSDDRCLCLSAASQNTVTCLCCLCLSAASHAHAICDGLYWQRLPSGPGTTGACACLQQDNTML